MRVRAGRRRDKRAGREIEIEREREKERREQEESETESGTGMLKEPLVIDYQAV